MDQDLRSQVWKIKRADSSLKKIAKKGDLLIFHGEGDTCGCICLSKKKNRRVIWENTYICEEPERSPIIPDLPFTMLSVSGAMLSQDHNPFLLDIALLDLGEIGLHLLGEMHEAHETKPKPLTHRIQQAFKNNGESVFSAKGKLTLPGNDGPFGHATGQWHAER